MKISSWLNFSLWF